MDSASSGAADGKGGYNWQTSDDVKEDGGATFGLTSVLIVFTAFTFLGAYLVRWVKKFIYPKKNNHKFDKNFEKN